MSKLKKCIIFFTIALTITLVITIYIVYKNRGEIIYGIDEEPLENTYTYNSTIQEVSVRNDYYVVKSCINKFYIYYSSIYSVEDNILIKDDEAIASIEKQKSKYIENVYSMLDEDYISYNNITTDNLTTKLSEIENVSVDINKMYISEKDENISIYFAYGKLMNSSKTKSEDFSIMVKVDMLNETFTVLLQDYVEEKYGNIAAGQNLELIYPEEIPNKGANIFDHEIIGDREYITNVLNDFKNEMLYDKETAYQKLNEEYRAKRFPTFEKFEQYIKDNIRKISVIKLSKYQKNNDSGAIQYICLDANDNYYIIDEISTMNCTFILDTYTLDLPEFITKYDESNARTKVALNIEKLKEALNAKDYEYVYNKSDETFRTNKFGSFEEFKNYLKSNLFEENTFEYKNVEVKADIYVATVVVSNKKDTNAGTKEMEVLMRISEDSTDYKISFNFGE